ncbi:hypothetical protein PVAND_008802 [Polypedilum vanderplanki]|uniref:ABC transporter domain-containing protein n=1 Tax=Polypedilum vanderplanki TaxID=319348 RepID=A0A9J6CAY3_POLVA|nr:hypothetical protein PVAND_008802 [Polypedilum vanderplanki]
MSFDKLKILLWKNWILQTRRPISAIFQLLFPIVVVILTTWARNSFGGEYGVFTKVKANEYNFTSLSECTFENKPITKVFFAPNFEAYRNLVEISFENLEIVGFNNSREIWEEIDKLDDQIGIILLSSDSEVTNTLPKNITHSISIRFRYADRVCELYLQHALERGFIKSLAANSNLEDVIVKNFPYEEQFKQIFTEVIIHILPLFLVFSMFATVQSVIKSVASERESKMKELMKIMGLSSVLHWSAWFIKCIIMSTISYTVVTLFLCVAIIGNEAIFQLSNFFLIWLFFFLYCIGVITFCFMVSTIFTKATVATNVGLMLFFSTYVPYYVYGTNFETLNHIVKWFFCIPINTSLGQGISMVLNLELNKQGITFSNLFTQVNGFNFTFFEILMIMIIASMIHILIMTYLELVFPGDVGVAKPWHFPFTFCFDSMRNNHKNAHNYTNTDNGNIFISNDDIEEEPKHLNVKVRIKNLTKIFGKYKAVNNLSLNIFEDQITVLLAHNGGGKTTTMNMLIGMIPPSFGTAYINDYDITTDIQNARKSLGICPQHNILFADLTVREHIIFFSRLKGMTNKKEIDEEVIKYVKMMDFVDKKDARSKTLSGGQQRKLSIANALCGGSTFVVLDEPTSGLDVTARRKLWDLLIESKKGRSILLSTHYLNEADVLGDRIAIMNEGQLKTIGTSFFLKKKFGSGYQLIIIKKPNFNVDKILNVLKQYAPDASVKSNEQLEAIFILSEEYLDKFDKIFKHLEDDSINLGIESFGCSLTTLEEVFLKVGVESNEQNGNGPEAIVKIDDLLSFSKVSQFTLFINQIYAMILKKIHFTRRNYAAIIMLTILTIWLTFVLLAAPVQLGEGTVNMDTKLTGLVSSKNSESNFIEIYKNFFNESNFFITDKSIFDYIYQNFLRNNLKYEIGVELDENKSVTSVYYNPNSYYNSLYVALNFYHRAILKELTNADHDIKLLYNYYESIFTNDDNDYEVIYDLSDRNVWKDITVYFLFFFLLTYWPVIHMTLKIKERVTKAKLLQFISGANKLIFTFTSFVLDVIIFLSIMFIIYGVVAALDRPGFNTLNDAAVYLTIFTFYAINIIPLIYLMSFLFKKHTTGEAVMQLIPVGFAILYLAYAILNTISLEIVGTIIYWIGIFFAPFSLVDCFVKIMDTGLFGGEFWKFGDKGIFLNLTLMAVGGVIFLTIVLLKDFLFFMWIRYKFFNKSKHLGTLNSQLDDDVLNEIQRVKNKTPSQIVDSNLVLKNLSKVYGKNLAVNQLYVGVEKAEIFGLLGVNGSGKTSVFKMLTGDEIISSGNAWIHGNSLIGQLSSVYKEIGYCPQYDALLPDLSGRETLKIFCLLRGIPRNEINQVIETFAHELDFYKHLDKKISEFSGGNRRKLSTTISLLGNLSLIFLDECSSGIDAKATRQLWNIINKTKNAGKSIIITSHSMQECEVLCNKLAIMVDGSFECLGSIQHLKNKFSKGYVLKIMMSKKEDEEHFRAIESRVMAKFPNAQLKERFMRLLTFHIDIPELKWSEVFAYLARMKEELGIDDYTMTQASLESVFLFFSKRGKQKDE